VTIVSLNQRHLPTRPHSWLLNAAIQASMAGDAGPALCVVADEVQAACGNARRRRPRARIEATVNHSETDTNESGYSRSRPPSLKWYVVRVWRRKPVWPLEKRFEKVKSTKAWRR